MNLYKKIALTVATLALSSASSSAVLLLTFTEEGSNVVMRTSGDGVTLDADSWVDDTRFVSGSSQGVRNGVYTYHNTDNDRFLGVDMVAGNFMNNNRVASSISGNDFYIWGEELRMFADLGADNNDSAPTGSDLNFNPATVMTWNSQTLDLMFGTGTHDRNTAISLWQNDNVVGADGNISFSLGVVATAAVPEPSSAALLGLGSLGLLLRRRR